MLKKSAGILLYRFRNKVLEVFIVHPGGPFWAKKDLGCWSIPKGEFTDEEDPLEAAKREFKEEVGSDIAGDFIVLNPIQLKNGKTIYIWAVEGNVDSDTVKSNLIEIDWPPKSSKKLEIPEVDKGGWFSIAEAKQKLITAQFPFIEELIKKFG